MTAVIAPLVCIALVAGLVGFLVWQLGDPDVWAGYEGGDDA